MNKWFREFSGPVRQRFPNGLKKCINPRHTGLLPDAKRVRGDPEILSYDWLKQSRQVTTKAALSAGHRGGVKASRLSTDTEGSGLRLTALNPPMPSSGIHPLLTK